MKNYLAIFLGTKEAMDVWKQGDEAARKEKEMVGMKAWMKWATDNNDSIVEVGSPLGKTKMVNKKGISDFRNELGAYTVVQAESHDDAAKLFLNHPHFTEFPGDRVEVMECLQIPTM